MTFDESLAATLRTFEALKAIRPSIQKAEEMILSTLRAGGKLLICGNGGSAAEAAHFATELTGRYARSRRPLPAVALSADGSATILATTTCFPGKSRASPCRTTLSSC